MVPLSAAAPGTTVVPPDYGGFPSGGTASASHHRLYGGHIGPLLQGGYLATLKIPSIDVNVKVYEGQEAPC